MAAGNASSSDVKYIPGLSAGAASLQYKVVKAASTAGQVIAVAATTDVALGAAQDGPAAGQPILVAYEGVVTVLAGANNLAVGDNLGYNTTGQVVAHTTDNRRSIGKALDASTAVGDYIRAMLYGGGSVRY